LPNKKTRAMLVSLALTNSNTSSFIALVIFKVI
jgi:hypothetical protein